MHFPLVTQTLVTQRPIVPSSQTLHTSRVCSGVAIYHITSTDIVRALVFRFKAFRCPVKDIKKFEEGASSDLRNLKPGVDMTTEEPKVRQPHHEYPLCQNLPIASRDTDIKLHHTTVSLLDLKIQAFTNAFLEEVNHSR